MEIQRERPCLALETFHDLERIYRSTKKLDVETEDNLQYKFYPVFGVVEFEVKASHDAHVALMPYPRKSADIIEIIIGGWNNSKSCIRRNGAKPEKAENKTKDILNGSEFRGFWVEWHRGNIKVGCKGDANAFLTWRDPEPFSINFVGLRTSWGSTGSWKIVVSEFYGKWEDCERGIVLEDGVVGGQDSSGELIYVARARHGGAMVPGKLITSHGCAYVPWNGQEQKKHEYQVLVGGPNNWISTSGSNIPPGAFPGGHAEDGELLYVGRVRHEGSLTTGKVQKSHGVCYISFGGQELSFPDYEILMP